MRSRALQPRTLFRIAGPGAASPTSVATASVVASSAAAAAVGGSATPSSSSSRSFALSHSHSPTASSPRFSSTHAASSIATKPRHRSRSASSLRRRSLSSPLQARNRYDLPVVPVRPPPHSNLSVGLQSFFSQGRPLLEHNNLIDMSAYSAGNPFTASQPQDPSASTDQHAPTAMIVLMPEGSDASDVSELTDLVRKHAAGELEAGQEDDVVVVSSDACEEVGADAKASKNGSPQDEDRSQILQQLLELSKNLANAKPARRQTMLQDALQELGVVSESKDSKSALKELDPHELLSKLSLGEGLSSQSSSLNVSLHLPALRSVSKANFDRVLDSMTSQSKSAGSINSLTQSPLGLHSSIATSQAWEAERRQAVDSALQRGEDVSVAEALGPEADLVVLGEPNGPKPEWGRGVASYLARQHAYGAPAPPRAGQAEAKTKTLDDLLTYRLSDASEYNGQESMFFDDAADASGSSAGPTSMEDANLMLDHALVQDRVKSSLEWEQLTAAMDGKTRGTQMLHKIRSAQSLVPSKNTTPQPVTSAVTVDTAVPGSGTSEQEERGQEQESTPGTIHMDSVRRKRRKKMNKMKYKKLRKKQRSERQKLKK